MTRSLTSLSINMIRLGPWDAPTLARSVHFQEQAATLIRCSGFVAEQLRR